MTEETSFADLLPVVQRTLADEPVQTVNARRLHAALDVGRDFPTWIRDRIVKYGFREGTDFVTETIRDLDSPATGNLNGRGGDRRSIEYHISLRMAAHVAMVQNNLKGQAIRDHFYKIESDYRKQLAGATSITGAQLANALAKIANIEATLEAVVAKLEPRFRLAVDDPQRRVISDGGLTPIFPYVEGRAAAHRLRNALVRRIGNEVARRCMERGIAVELQIGRDHVRLFPRHVVEQFMRDVGDRWIAEHNAQIKGQGVLPFVVADRKKGVPLTDLGKRE